MGLLNLLGRGFFGAGAPGSGSFVLAAADNADGTATATISEAPDNEVVEVYTASAAVGIDSAEWTLQGSRNGDGTLVLNTGAGFYWVIAIVPETLDISNIAGVQVTVVTPEDPIILGVPGETDLCREIVCGSDCEWIFDRLDIYPTISGGTRVEWILHPRFGGAEPYTYQIQFGRTGNPLANDWTDVGNAQQGGTFLTDPLQRVYGKFQWTHYRVLLTTRDNITYASKPQSLLGRLDKRDWLRAREIKRLENKRLQHEAGTKGWLLKRRHFGAPCTCLDELTEEIRDPECTLCYGTGILNGYFDPYPCFFVEMGLTKHRLHLDPNRGSVNDEPVIACRLVNDPQVMSYDVFVEEDTDIRWFMHQIVSRVEVRGMPVVVDVEFRQAPFSDIVYRVPIT